MANSNPVLDIQNYKTVIFDWDGTIVDTCGLILDAHNHVRGYMGQALWTMDDFLGRASKSAREYYPEIYGERAEEAQVVLYDYVEKHHLNYLEPIAGSHEILAHLGALKIPMGVVSNKRHATLLKEIEVTGMTSHFKVMIGAGFSTRDKPAPDPLLQALGVIDAGFSASDVLYVGDTETDLLCAQNTKCDVVFVQSDKPRPDLIEKYAPKYAYHSLAEFHMAVTNAPAGANNKAVKA